MPTEQDLVHLGLTGYELIMVIESMYDAVLHRLDLIIGPNWEFRVDVPFDVARNTLDHMTSVYGKLFGLWSTVVEEPDEDDLDWKVRLSLPESVWETITTVLTATSWGEVPLHNVPEPYKGHCEFCDTLCNTGY